MSVAVLEAPSLEYDPNKDNLRKWVADLRSGKFQQGKGTLKSKDKFCCLGVACETAIANGVPLTVKVREHDDAYVSEDDEEWSGALPPPVQEWLGIPGDDNITWDPGFPGEPDNAIGANDSYGWDFNQIADRLEKHFGLVPDA